MCNRLRFTYLAFIVLVFMSGFTVSLQAQPDRIHAPIAGGPTVVLPGHVPPRARPEFDQGPVAPSFPLPAITIYLKPTPSQQTALRQLLAAQQNPASPDFHKWLTPEQYADRFGASQNDVNRISAWLKSQGLDSQRVARSRTWIQFSGTAQQVENAFHTQIHRYLENGQLHYANSSDPSVPAALSPMVLSVRGMNDFRLKPLSRRSSGLGPDNTTGNGDHQMAPDDFATIYDVAPLYTEGIDGTGQKLVIVGQTDINVSDIQAFRAKFNLPAMNLQQILVPGQADPGIDQNNLPEADLDLEWSGAVARGATIIYVNSGDVFTSVVEAIDQAYAPVISMSYGVCEGANLGALPTEQQLAQQANSEGITWLAASGDNGAAACEDANAAIAQDGLAVGAPGSIPEVTSMGGSEFNEAAGSFWGSNTANGASALSYIPEMVWNDTSLGGGLAAGGGGGSSFFPQPVWQTGPGVPNDGLRHVPDLSIASSADHDGYFVSTGGAFQIYGGTSMAAPTMAGIVALLNHYLVSSGVQNTGGLGNINPTLYRMAQSAQKAPVFHDITAGNNSVPCVRNSPNCSTGSVGFNAGPAYDQASGLGSPDAFNLIHQWHNNVNVPAASAVVASIDQNPVFESVSRSGSRWAFSITLTEEAGVATTLTGFTVNGQSEDVATVFGATQIPADGSVSSTGLGFNTLAVPAKVVFTFSGVDASGRQWTETLTVPFDGPQPQLQIGGVGNSASGKQAYAPGMLVSVYGVALGDFVQLAGTIPLPQYLAGFEASVNGVPTPIYYVSPNQVNIQIPYETAPGTAELLVGNPYANSNNYAIQIVPAAPGIFLANGFAASPFSSVAAGQTTTLYITGEGQVSPSLATGMSPAVGTPLARLPKPNLPVSVTVAGQTANIAFVGIPAGFVGVTQINYQVPANTPPGVQPVVVTVGDVASQPANITVTN